MKMNNMDKVRKSLRLTLPPSNRPAKHEVLVGIKDRRPLKKPAEKIVSFEVSIEYICDKCNKKYTTKLGLIRHIKFCIDTASINRKILNGRRKIITTLSDGRRNKPVLSNLRTNNNINLLNGKSKNDITFPNRRIKKQNSLLDNHNDLNSQNLNLRLKPVPDKETSLESDSSNNNNRKRPDNMCELGGNLSDPNNSEEEEISLAVKTPELCGCCGKNAATAHKTIFKCRACKKPYRIKASLDAHMNEYHSTKKGAIQCKLCKASCANDEVYTDHMQIHNSDGKKLSCKHCKNTFSKMYNLRRHLEQTGCDGRKKPILPCQVCGVEFSRKDNLRDHLRMHVGKGISKKIYKCDICKKDFKGKTMVAIHMRTHTGETPFPCKHCKKAFKSKGALNKHERCHTGEKPYKCNECNRRFAAKETLNRHLLVHMEEKPYTCNVCGKSFIQCTQLRAHMFYHTGDYGFKCKYCDMMFNRKLKLKTHENFEHEGARKVRCTVSGCDKFFMKKDLARHMITHSDEKPYACNICSKSFKTRALLTTHTVTHRKENPRSCPLCVRDFIRFDCLLRHLRSRHKDKYKEALVAGRMAKLELMKSKLKKSRGKGAEPNQVTSTKANRKNSSDITEEILMQIAEDGIGSHKTSLRNRAKKRKGLKRHAYNEDSEIAREALMIIAAASEDIEVEIVDLPLSDDHLAYSIQELLDLLIDKDSFETFNLGKQTVDDVLEGLIIKCGHTAAPPEITGRPERLRENAKLLLTVVIDDDPMKALFDTQTVDEVILNVLRLGRTT